MAFSFKVNDRAQRIDVDGAPLLQALHRALGSIQAQVEGTITLDFTATLCGEITIQDGCVVHANLGAPRLLQMSAAPVIDADAVRL